MRARPLLYDTLPTLAGAGVLLILWTAAHLAIGRYFPSPVDAVGSAASNLTGSRYFEGLGLPAGGFVPHLISTTKTTLIGCLLGSGIGIASGLLSHHSSVVFQVTRPIAGILGTVPILVAAPFSLIWFGVSDDAKIFLVAFYSAVTLHIVALAAVANLNPFYAASARSLGADGASVFLRVSLPGSMPDIFGGLRTALSAAWGLSTITELLGTDRGIGRVITACWAAQDMTALMAAIMLLSVIAITADAILMAIRDRALHWAPRVVVA